MLIVAPTLCYRPRAEVSDLSRVRDRCQGCREIKSGLHRSPAAGNSSIYIIEDGDYKGHHRNCLAYSAECERLGQLYEIDVAELYDQLAKIVTKDCNKVAVVQNRCKGCNMINRGLFPGPKYDRTGTSCFLVNGGAFDCHHQNCEAVTSDQVARRTLIEINISEL